MISFIATSAFLAVLNARDLNYQRARSVWEDLIARGDSLICSNYVLVETLAVIQNRLGMEAVKILNEDVLPVLSVRWVDEPLHSAALSALLIANRRQLSLVDCVSFEMMRRLGIRTVFTFDSHFHEQGFDCLP